MKKYLAITAALALVLTACGHAAPNSTQTLTAATETTQAMAAPAEPPQGIGSGALRMLTAAADGVYYQAFNDWEINYTDTMGRALVYAIDEQTGDARPVCNLPGCAHNSDTCPAWCDGNTTLCYGDGDEVYLLNFYYNDETSYYSWEQINSDHTRRTVLARIEPGQSVVGRGVAVDDVNLYYSLLDEDNRHQTLWAVDPDLQCAVLSAGVCSGSHDTGRAGNGAACADSGRGRLHGGLSAAEERPRRPVYL